MEKSKTGVCERCNMTEGSSCSKWCAGCTLHRVLRVIIMVVALCAAYSFGQQVGMLKAMILSDAGFMPHQNMMYRHNTQDDRMVMPAVDATIAAPAAVKAAPVKN